MLAWSQLTVCPAGSVLRVLFEFDGCAGYRSNRRFSYDFKNAPNRS